MFSEATLECVEHNMRRKISSVFSEIVLVKQLRGFTVELVLNGMLQIYLIIPNWGGYIPS